MKRRRRKAVAGVVAVDGVAIAATVTASSGAAAAAATDAVGADVCAGAVGEGDVAAGVGVDAGLEPKQG